MARAHANSIGMHKFHAATLLEFLDCMYPTTDLFTEIQDLHVAIAKWEINVLLVSTFFGSEAETEIML